MKKLLILILTICSIAGYGQTQLNPSGSNSVANINNATTISADVAGTDTYTTTIIGATLTTRKAYSFTFQNACTGTPTPTININDGTNNLGAIGLKKFNSSGSLVNITAGDIWNGDTKRFRYNGTNFVMEGGSGSGGAPSGSAGGDLTGTYPDPTLATSGVSAATYGSATQSTQVTFDAKGRATSASSVSIAIPESAVTNLTSDLAAKQATLVSGTNIKTVNSNSLVGSGNVAVGDLLAANNLSEVTPSTARTNLGLGTAALISSTAGGDLSGTLPSPIVAKINGNTVPANASGVLTNNGSGTLTWAAAGGAGTVSSVGLSLPSLITVSGSPVTTTGTLTGTLASQNNSTHFVGPLPTTFGNTGAPTFRTLENSDMYFRNKWKLATTGTPFFFSDSYGTSQQASSTAIGYVKQLAGINGFTENNQSVGSRGIAVAAYASYSAMPTFNNSSSSFILVGFNDWRRNGSASATQTKVAGGLRAICVNTWLKFGIAASAVTNTGTWSNYTNANGSLKAINLSGNARQSSTSGDLLTYTTTTASDNIVIGTVNSDGTTANYGRFTVTIDGTVVQTFDPNGRTDAISDGAQDNSVVPEVLVFTSLKNSTHVVTLTLLDSKTTVIDYIGYMREPAYCAAVFISTPPRMDATGYATSPANSSDAVVTTVKSSVYKAVCESFVDRPVSYIDLDQYWNVSTSLGADHIHPNDQGYTDIKTAFQSAIINNVQAAGTPLNNVTSATISATVDHANNGISWTWNTQSNQFPFQLSSSSTTWGSAYALSKFSLTGANGTSSVQSYAAQFSNTKTGTTPFNVAVYANATGGANNSNNFCFLAPNGTLAIGAAFPTLPTTETRAQILGASSSTVDIAGTTSFARILLRDLSQASNVKNWSILNSGTNFSIDRVNDAVNSTTNRFLITSSGLYGFNVTSPSAVIHMPAGTATANTAPMKFTSGTNLTTAEAGAVEYNGSHYETKLSTLRYAKGGTIADFFTDGVNTSTTETDLYTYTTPASTLGVNGEKLIAQFTAVSSDATASSDYKIYFGGTVIYDSGVLGTTTGTFVFNVTIIRTGATTVRAIVSVIQGITTGTSGPSSTETDVTGLTLSNTNIIKITGQAGGATGGSSDITAKMGYINWFGAANN